MIRRLRRAVQRLQRTVHRWRYTPAELDRLSRDPHPAVAALARSLDASLRNHLTPEETAWVERIEGVRRNLLASEETLPAWTGNPQAGATERVAGVCRAASKRRGWGVLLLHLLRARKPEVALELGTCLGISAAYQAAALHLNGAGRLITLEGAAPRAVLAERNLRELGLDAVDVVTGFFSDTLPGVLAGRTDMGYAFIDGHHDGSATRAYFEQLLPHLAPNAVLVFDDIAWSDDMQRAWQAITGHPRVIAAVDMYVVGVCVVGRGEHATRRYRLALW